MIKHTQDVIFKLRTPGLKEFVKKTVEGYPTHSYEFHRIFQSDKTVEYYMDRDKNGTILEAEIPLELGKILDMREDERTLIGDTFEYGELRTSITISGYDFLIVVHMDESSYMIFFRNAGKIKK